MPFLRTLLVAAIFLVAGEANCQPMASLTNQRDTSFNTASDYGKSLKKYPFIKIATEEPGLPVKKQPGIVYCRRGDRRLLLDAFLPLAKTKGRRPAILVIHGGGWRSGDRSQHHPLAQQLAARGYACFTPEYRLSTEALYPAAVHDLKAALRWMHDKARKYGIDTGRIAVLGFSAGGELAAFLAVTQGMPALEGEGCRRRTSSSVQALVDLDGTLSFVHPESGEGDDSKKTSASSYWFGYARKDSFALWKDASPLTHAGPNTPPTLFINSSVDRMHAGRNEFTAVLQQHGIHTEVRSIPDTPHTFPLYHPWFELVVQYTDDFLKKVFSPNPSK